MRGLLGTATPWLRLLPLVAIVVPLLMLGAFGWSVWKQAIAQAEQEMHRSANAGAQSLARSLEAYRAGLGRANDQLRGLSDDEVRANARPLSAALAQIIAELPQSAVAYVIARDGAPLLASDIVPVPAADFRDRDYFSSMAAPDAPTLHVSELFVGRFDNRLLFAIARRRTGGGNQPAPRDGFDGVVVISVDPAVIAQNLRDLLSDPRDRLVVLNRAGRLVSGSAAPSGPAREAPLSFPTPGDAIGARPADGSRAVTAAREVSDFGLTIISARPRAVVFEQWWRAISSHLIFGVPATLAMLWLSLRVRSDQLRLGTANAALEADLRQGSERLSRVKRFGLIGTFEYDLRTGVSRRSSEYMSVHGQDATPAEERHADWVRRLHPDDRARAEQHLLATLADPGVVEYGQTYRTILPNGEVRWIAARGEIERDAQGRALLMRGAHVDVTPLRTTELALAESDARLRLAQEAVEIGTFEWLPAGNSLSLSRKLVELWRFAPGAAEPTVAQLAARVHPAHRRALYRQVLDGRRRGRFRAEFPLLVPDGGGEVETLWIAIRARRLRTEDGPDGQVMGVGYDITDRKRAEENAALLAHEVEHRAKNVLAIVTSLLRVTDAETLDEYVDVLEGRVKALGGAMTLLGKRNWSGVMLHDLLAHEMLPFGDAARLDGPEVVLPPDAAQSLSMALHELATNAAKYGALSRPDGVVEVRWRLDGELVRLDWTETGGPPVAGPPERQSFGSMLIRQTFEAQLGGGIEKIWAPAGLVCRVYFRRGQLTRA